MPAGPVDAVPGPCLDLRDQRGLPFMRRGLWHASGKEVERAFFFLA